jgi:hypothetical protein
LQTFGSLPSLMPIEIFQMLAGARSEPVSLVQRADSKWFTL